MPLQNRVTPTGELIADPARGLFLGNRGGRFHRDDRSLGARRWASRRWICCRLAFKGRRREVWSASYTELFFLDEPTALAAGHRPCFECRRAEATAFAAAVAAGQGAMLDGVDALDRLLHAERLDGRRQRRHRRRLRDLPDGAMVAGDGAPWALRGGRLLRWTPRGYDRAQPVDIAEPVEVLTPPAIVAALAAGYRPHWHPSADAARSALSSSRSPSA